jgi:hypothetical protein
MNKALTAALLALLITACDSREPDGTLTVHQIAHFDDCTVNLMTRSVSSTYIVHCKTGTVAVGQK